MFVQQVSIEINSDADPDEVIDQFVLLDAYYRDNGQIQGATHMAYLAGDTVFGLHYTLEENSLDRREDNFYVNKQVELLEKNCRSKLKIETIGRTYLSPPQVCTCKQPEFYILYTTYVSLTSPVKCGTCWGAVPLYRLPIYDDHGYVPILNWETNYISCDSLQMNCKVGEQWALKQMLAPNSQLSQQGRKICGRVAELTKTPTYYFLFDYRKNVRPSRKKFCPVCEGNWKLELPLHGRFDFKCDICCLLSAVSRNT